MKTTVSTTKSLLGLFHDVRRIAISIFAITLLVGCASTPRPLVDAADQGDWDEVKRLVVEDTEIDQLDYRYGKSALHKAVEKNNQEMVEYLLKNGADINLNIRANNTALHLAAWHGYASLVEYLIANNARMTTNKKGMSPLHMASHRGHEEVVKVLIDAGADINAKTLAYKTPLSIALKEGHDEVVDLLQQHGGKK